MIQVSLSHHEKSAWHVTSAVVITHFLHRHEVYFKSYIDVSSNILSGTLLWQLVW